MGQMLHPLLVFYLFVSLFPAHFLCKISETKGFSLNLVRRAILDTNTSYFPETIRPIITRSDYLYTIDAAIGTPSRKRTFIFDLGSKLTWTQCTPCTRCFKQDYPLFDPKQSTSYKALSSDHALARFFKCSTNGGCIFNTSYLSGESSSGIGSIETFTLQSNKNVPERINNVVFGCTNANTFQGQISSNTLVTGIMGMSRSPLSFISQMGIKSVKRFSYCLPSHNSPIKSTFLRFGSDVKERGSFKKTSFVKSTDNYSIKLQGISIGGQALKLPQNAFSKGCIVDSGSGLSTLEMAAYTQVLISLQNHFNRFNLTRVKSDPKSEGDLCYLLKPGFKNYPSMTLHFEGRANLEIVPENLFRILKNNRFCLGLKGSPNLTVLGAYQQQNVMFIFDLANDKLLFSNKDCSKDKA